MNIEIKELLEFPLKLTQAICRGLGRLAREAYDPYRGNPYINMTPEERLQIEERDRL